MEYLEGPVFTKADIDEAEDYAQAAFGHSLFNRDGWEYILKAYGGRLPIRICALDEGLTVPSATVAFTIEDTDIGSPWVSGWVEPILEKTWYPTTVATLTKYVVEELRQLLVETGCDPEFCRYMLHNFGYRATGSEETAAIGSCAHLIHANGTDTQLGMSHAMQVYGGSLRGLASTCAATEHRVMTQGGRAGEGAVVQRVIQLHPKQVVSQVADSYDYKAFVQHAIDIYPLIEQKAVRLVIRPDSVTSDLPRPDAVVLWTLNTVKEGLGQHCTATPTGHIRLPYSVLWGDGIDRDGIMRIARAAARAGFAVDNLVFGMGANLLQKMNRDTLRWAQKGSAQLVSDGRAERWEDISKTTYGKSSRAGRLAVVKDDQLHGFSGYQTIREEALMGRENLLRPVFENGTILRKHTFEQVRARARRFA
jgi:nicotinamide phosphoribosyltransferase